MNFDLTQLLVAGIPLMLVVMGIVQFVKEKLGFEGKAAEIFAISLGVVFGFAFHVYNENAFILSFRFIFEGLMYGLIIGLTATGIYKVNRLKNPKEEDVE